MELEVSIKKTLKDFTLEIDFSVSKGEIVGLLGESGSGKSMTLKSIAGIVRPDGGVIRLNGTTLFDSERKIDVPTRNRNVGYMFQSYALFPYMTVAQNVACGIKDPSKRKETVSRNLELLHIDKFADRYPRHLSGGQQQRVALARLLAASPSVIMLDEPFSALDNELKDSLQEELKSTLERSGCPILFVSHNREEVQRYCTRSLHLSEGRLLP
ncbi:MAG: sulfate/molybdate ABC transporter ATP-binding protein [Sphaerochaetaceae bacterium]|jgi:molybdate transport system ATP-binding protein